MVDMAKWLALLIVLVCEYPAFSQTNLGQVNSGQSSITSDQIGADNAKQSSNGLEIPPPPAIALPEPAILGESPNSLAWRLRAFTLANEYPIKKNSLIWALPIAYNKGQSLLRQAISQLGLQVLSQYAEAGQFLISSPDSGSKYEIIVVSQPVSENTTLFKMRTYLGSRIVENQTVSTLPDVMKNLLANQGLWQ